ncbi:MAG: chemotaxis protein CheA [Acidobacteria bacterium]|nr:MAG: chemotaxis protein CheA [Acidobacteriota bacterium]
MSDFQASPELLAIYLEDARQHLEALDHCLLTLEREGTDPEAVTAVLGPLHTLKGNSGMIGFPGIKDYVHRLEDVFARVHEGALALDREAFDRLFAGATALRDAIEQASREGREVRGLEAEKADLEGLMSEAARPPVTVAPPISVASAPAGPTAPTASLAPPRPSRIESHYTARSSVVRVEFAQLDHLLNLVGELIIHRTKLQDLGKALAEMPGAREAARDLLSAVHQVAGVSQQLQETVMDVRMLPIRHVFERFPRLVRDLARETGKEIELILEGEGTRIDKAIIDEIGEPLVHLIRNSVDHGIEAPAVRVTNGKTPTGTILLSATQESNHVVITIMDDGAGIDAETVRHKAVERGLLKADDAVSDRDVVQLIFSQGFSTREAITEVSGRGVGLDVVLRSIERLNGLVEVETVPGVGTKFIIQLPLTLAIISALLVDVTDRTYAIPLGSVVESIQLRGAEGRGDKRVGVVVNRLRGQQEVVIKALDPAVSGAEVAMAGATIMGDGRVVLILDVASLFDGKRLAALHGRLPPALEA